MPNELVPQWLTASSNIVQQLEEQNNKELPEWFLKSARLIEAKAYEEGDSELMGTRSSPTILEVIESEGGFQDDPDDRGNWVGDRKVGTKYGITAHSLAAFRGVSPYSITVDDIRNLTPDDAYDIYEKNYIKEPGFDALPEGRLKESIIDMGINAGPSRAIRLLQRTAGIDEDGIIGPQTLEAFGRVTPNAYRDTRISYYESLVEANPVNKKYINGWTERANRYSGTETYQVASNDE